MKTLAWKELRELLWPVVIAAGCCLLTGVLGSTRRNEQWLLMFWMTGMPLAALMLGAHAVAKERTRRTLQWQALWPVSRARWWSVKLVVHLIVFAVGFALVLLAACALGPWQWPGGGVAEPLGQVVIVQVGFTFLFFALAFLMSNLRRSTFEAFGLSLLTGLLLMGVWAVVASDVLPGWLGPRLGISLDSQRPWAILTTGFGLGLACLIAAAWATLSTPALAFRRRSLRGGLGACALVVAAIPCLILGGLYLTPAEKPDFGKITDVRLSPDGRTVAFTDDHGSFYAGEAPRLWTMGVDGAGLRCVARGPVWGYEWLPDNRRLVCEWGHRLPGFHHLLPVRGDRWWWLVDSAGAPSRKLPVTDLSPIAISPKGTYLAASYLLVDLRTLGRAASLQAPITDQAPWTFWAWADDESALYLVRGPSMYGAQMHTTPSIDRIDIFSGTLTRGVYKIPPGATLATPEGQSRWVALNWKNPSRCTLVALDGSGSVTVPNARPFARCIAPDGRHAWLHDGSSVFVVDLQARKVVRRLGGPGVFDSVVPKGGPYFSPDGREVAFRAVSPAGHRLPYVTSADGSASLRPLRLRRNHTGNNPVVGWTADGQLLLCYDEGSLVKLSLDGRETDLLVAAGPRRDEPRESAD